MIRKSYLYIPIDKIDIEYAKNLLTYSFENYQTKELVTEIFYEINNIEIKVPRFFNNIINIPEKEIIDLTTEGEVIDIDDSITLRQNQLNAISFLINNSNGILKLPPGRGKTVITIKYISQLKRKTMIIVDMDKLATQWVTRIIENTNLKESDIGIFKANKIDLDKPIVIVSIQSIVSKLRTNSEEDIYNLFYNANFGLTIMDEVHSLIGSPEFSKVGIILMTKQIFGLSATPYRTDSKSVLIKHWLGSNIHDESEYELIPNVYVDFYNSELFGSKTWKWISFGGQFNRMRYLKMLSKNKNYMEYIRLVILQLLKQDRNVLIISEIKAILEEIIMNNPEIKDQCGYFVGGADDSEMHKQYVFTTYKMCNKGIDNVNWDTLILATPVSSPIILEQTIGRILRTKKFKKQPIVIDIVDTTYPQIFISMASKRINFYKIMNFNNNINISKLNLNIINKFKLNS